LQQYQELEIPAGQPEVIGKGIKNITNGEIEKIRLINFARNTDKLTGYKYYYYCPETGHTIRIIKPLQLILRQISGVRCTLTKFL
jgi:hypothetical protein